MQKILRFVSSFSVVPRLLLAFGMVAGFGLIAYLHAADGAASATNVGAALESGPVVTRGAGDSCVADTDFMRRNHMQVLLHQRDETVISGLRDQPYSLVGCVNCHAHPVSPAASAAASGNRSQTESRAGADGAESATVTGTHTDTAAAAGHAEVEYQRIDAPGQFCSSCHEYAAVKIDCFSCHAAKPAAGAGLVAGLEQSASEKQATD